MYRKMLKNKKTVKKLNIFEKTFKKVLTLVSMCGILTMHSANECNGPTDVGQSTMTTTYFD